MKHTELHLTLSALLMFSLWGCSTQTAVQQEPAATASTVSTQSSDPAAAAAADSESDAENYIGWYLPEYQSVIPADVFQASAVCVKGKFGKTISTKMDDSAMIVTEIEFHVDHVYKGETKSETINVKYYGGTISFDTYLKSLSEEEIKNRYGDISSRNLPWKTVTFSPMNKKEAVSVNQEDTYVLFLSYNKEEDTYFILSDAYGACKTSDGLIYDLTKDAYTDMAFLME